MHPKADALVAAARSMVDTPYQHQACLPGVGLDCAQLCVAVGIACGLFGMPPANERRYGRIPRPDEMQRLLSRYADPIAAADAGPGDMVWIQWHDELPMHLGILTHNDTGPGIVHATAVIGRVVEHDFEQLRARAHSYWRYK